MNKTIYLIMPDTQNGRRNYIPYALLFLGNSLKNSGYVVRVRHCIEKELDGVAKEICNEKPLLVGISTITGLHLVFSASLSKKIKALDGSIKICWGGVHPSLLPEQCLKEDYIDYVINGEGEETIVELANQLLGDKDFSSVKGLGFKQDGVVHVPERRFVEDLSKVRADFSLINVESYFTSFPEGQKRVLTYITSRGCPHRCKFCYNQSYNNRKWRMHSMETVKSDIDFLKEEYKIDGMKFVDDNFFVNKKRAFEILEYLNLPSTSEIRVDYFLQGDLDDFMSKLKKHKVLEILVGFESGSERTQELVQKDYTVKEGITVINLLAKHHIRCHYSFIIALPGETYEDIKETVNVLLYIMKKHKEGTFTPGQYLPYPGTPLYEKAIEMGFRVPENTEGWAILDRWDNKMELPWSPVDSNFCYYIKWYTFFVGARIPFITAICKSRLRTLNFKYPFDLKLFLKLYRIAYHTDSAVGKIIKNTAKIFQFKLKNADK